MKPILPPTAWILCLAAGIVLINLAALYINELH